jgi:hypothetical protein
MTRTWHWRLVLGLLACGCSNETAGQTPTGGVSNGGQAGSSVVSAGSPSQGGSASSGGAGSAGNGGADGATAGNAGSGGGAVTGCDAAGLTWKTARKTWYTSYPDPNSEECVEYNGCMWAGMFAACSDKKPEAWVESHNIVAAFPGFEELELHDLCLKSGDKTIVVTVYDTCADSDCSGCCTQNQADNDALIDLESYTNERWGVEDGQIQWADLGPTSGGGCD